VSGVGLNLSGQISAASLEVVTEDMITSSMLANDLAARIDLIDADASVAGSVNKRVADEAIARAQADTLEAEARVEAINLETHNRLLQVQENAESILETMLALDKLRVSVDGEFVRARTELTKLTVEGLLAEATSRTTLAASLATDIATTQALISEESVARSTALESEASQRLLLAAQMRGDYTGSDLSQITSGLLYIEREARADADDALSQQITLLSAGAGEQFDWKTIWYYDTGVESWTGNGTPTATSGWLRAANQASGAYVESPTGLSVDGVKYGQVRLRVRKTGTVTWAGYLYWKGTGDTTWDNARRIALTEPTWDTNNIGLVTINVGWTVTVIQIRVDLSSAQDASNYTEIDWVAIGRPSPGASTAQLLEEQTARAGADGAMADDIITLDSTLNDPTEGLGATRAKLINEYYTKAAADQATASAQTTLITTFGPTNNRIFRQTTAPTQGITSITLRDGTVQTVPLIRDYDVWYDSDDGNKPHLWITGSWVYAPDLSATATQAFKDNLELAVATPTTATVTTWSNAVAKVEDPATGLTVTRASLLEFQQTQSTLNGASARDTKTLYAAAQDIDEDLLRAMLDGEATRNTLNQTVALARQELQANITLGLEAEASARQILVARLDETDAVILEEQTVRATETEALAESISRMTAAIDSNFAAIVREESVRISEDGIIVDALDELSAQVNNATTGLPATRATVLDIDNAKIGYCTIGGNATDHKTRQTCEAAGGTWTVGLPLATAVKQVSVSDGSSSLTLEQRFTAQKTTNDGLSGQYTVKIDNDGYVSGFGLASTTTTAGPYSDFQIRADRFSVTNPNAFQASISTLTRSSTTATMVTSEDHDLAAGQDFSIRGVTNDGGWNRTWKVLSVVNPTTITFTVPNTLTTPAVFTLAKMGKASVPFIVVDGVVWINSAYIKTITASQIDTRGLDIKDSNGNVFFSVQEGLDWTNVNGIGKPADNATRNVVTQATTAPVNPVEGDLWIDTSGTFNIFKLYQGGTWVTGANALSAYTALTGKPASLGDINSGEGTKLTGIAANATRNVVTQSGSAPGSPVDGDIWVDTSGSFYIIKLYKTGTGWVTGANALTAYTALTGRPASLGDINSGEGTKLTGISAGATRNQVTYSAVAPGSPLDGDLWVDTSGTYAVFKLRTGGAWQTGANALNTYTALTGIPTTLADINSTESSKLLGIAAGATRNQVTYSASAPVSPADGDLWVDTSGTYFVFKVRTGGAWVAGANALSAYSALTGRPAGLSDINATEGTKLSGVAANATRNSVTYSASAPGSPVDGDLWVDISGSYTVFKLRSGGAWVTGANALTAYANLTGVPTSLSQINAGESSKLSGIATGATRNIVTYSTSAPVSPVDGDLWVDTSGTYAIFKLYSGGGWVTGANALSAYSALTGRPTTIADINTTESAKLAGIANNATRNQVTYSGTAPGGPVDGDLWVDTSGTFAVFKLRSGGAWVTGANALTAYNALSGKPVSLADINSTESSKLAGIEAGATVGAQAGVNLKDGSGFVLIDSQIKNTAITITQQGQLLGAGGGTVTASGLGVQTYRAISVGTWGPSGSRPTQVPATQGLYQNGTLTVVAGRSYNLVVISRSTGQIVGGIGGAYDVYGVGEIGGRTAANLAADLNSLDASYIVCVYGHDEPRMQRSDSGLPAAMYRCGASRTIYGSSKFGWRASYVLVGIPGCGEGNGAEVFQNGYYDENGQELTTKGSGWCELSFQVVNGVLTGVSASRAPLTLVDLDYVGASNATYGADWSVNLTNIPTEVADGRLQVAINAQGVLTTKVSPTAQANPSLSGLYLASDYMGYYNQGTGWKTYMDNAGNFFLGGTNGALRWNGGSLLIYGSGQFTGELAVGSGTINYTTGTGIWAGFDQGIPKFRVGSPTQYMRWTGDTIEIKYDGPLTLVGDYYVTDWALSPNDVYAQVVIKRNGEVWEYVGSPSVGTKLGNWHDPNGTTVGDNYQIKFALISGSTPTGGSSLNTWHALTNDRYIDIVDTTNGFSYKRSVLSFTIRRTSSQIIVGSGTIEIETQIEI
jgi:hypothetical protein